MSKRKATGAQVNKRRSNFTGVEMKREILFSSVNEGYKHSQKNEAWDCITREVNMVSGQGRTSAEIKKKWADVKSAKKKISKGEKREHGHWRRNSGLKVG